MEYQTDCSECGKSYTAKRSTSKYCSAKCRQRANRKHTNNVNVGAEGTTIMQAVNRLLDVPASELYHSALDLQWMFAAVDQLKEKMEAYAFGDDFK